jgi:hypothetical protein
MRRPSATAAGLSFDSDVNLQESVGVDDLTMPLIRKFGKPV